MTRARFVVAAALSVVAAAGWLGTARAGGWTVVTLDSLPDQVRAGENVRLGMMVRQHGQTPINAINGQPLEVVLTATNLATSESVSARAVQDGPTGHFVVDVTFPAEGTWQWSIQPKPFQPSVLAPIIVVAADTPSVAQRPGTAAPSMPAETEAAPGSAPVANTGSVRFGQREIARGAGLALLAAAALSLFVTRRRPGVRREARA